MKSGRLFRAILLTLTIALMGVFLNHVSVESVKASFGISRYGEITGYVWDDQDGDGIRDAGEGNLESITVNYWYTNGSVWDTVSTDSTAAPGNNYLFSDLPTGGYWLWVNAPAGKQLTTSFLIFDNLTSGETFQANWGLQDTSGIGTLSGFVWEDVDQNQTRNGTEENVPGFPTNPTNLSYWGRFTITYDSTPYGGSTTGSVDTDDTAAPGDNFSVPGLPAGDYDVELTPVYAYTPITNPPNPQVVTIPSGGTGRAEFGILPARLQGFVFDDTDEDGVYDAGEQPIPDVDLLGTQGFWVVAEAITDSSPYPVNYEIFTAGGFPWGHTCWGAGPPDCYEWHAEAGGGQIPTISAGTTYTSDFALRHMPAFEGRVCDDQNADGICQAGEPNLNGITLDITTQGPTGSIQTQTTTPFSHFALSTSDPSFNYLTFDTPDHLYSAHGQNEISVVVPAGKVLLGAPQPRIYTHTPGERRQEDFALADSAGLGSIEGYVWDDSLDRNRVFDATDDPITDNVNFIVTAYDDVGTVLGTDTPDPVDGSYAITGLPAASNHYVALTTPTSHCRGDAVKGETGWNDGTSGYDYATAASPYETPHTITVAAGGATTVDLGAVTDYRLYQQPPGNISIIPGTIQTVEFFVEEDPCWGGTSVDAEFIPDNWPAELQIFGTPTPSNPATFNPSDPDPANRRMVVRIIAYPNAQPGTHLYTFEVDHTSNPTRGYVLGGSITIATNPWVQVQGGEIYGGYEGAGDSIFYRLPDTPTGGYFSFFNTLGELPEPPGMVIAKSTIDIATVTGGTSIIGENTENYGGDYTIPVTAADFAGVTTDCDMKALVPGSACRATVNSFYTGFGSSTYDLTGPGVAVVYWDYDDVGIFQKFRSSSPLDERVVAVIRGNVSISSPTSVGSSPPDASSPADIEAAVFVLGNQFWMWGDGCSGCQDVQIKIDGGLYLAGSLNNQLSNQGNTAPSLVVQHDPTFQKYPVEIFSSGEVQWREVDPLE